MPTVTITESLGTEVATAVSLTVLTRSDTGLVPSGVTLPLAFTNQGGGTAWGVSFTDPAALPARYDYTFRITWPDASYSDATSFITPGAATGFWTTQSAVEQEFGVEHCRQDVDLNNTGNGTAAVWQQALNWVDSLIDRIFAQAGYARPTDLTSTDYTLVSGYAASMVRNEIHGGRGSTETNGAGGPATGGVFQKDADAAERAIRLMAVRGVSFAKVSTEANVGPSSIAPTVDRFGYPVRTSANPWPVRPWGYGYGWGYGGWC